MDALNNNLIIRWSPRVPKEKIRRLYESDADGLLDEELVDDVGITLLLRVRDILTIRDAHAGKVRCPVCQRNGKEVFAPRLPFSGDKRDQPLRCPECNWRSTWGEYAKAYRKRQLNPGGATKFFEAYANEYPSARNAREKFLAIDLLLHEFHYSLASQPDLPTRPASVNLIEGRMHDIVEFLDNLTYGEHLPYEVKARQAKWRAAWIREEADQPR